MRKPLTLRHTPSMRLRCGHYAGSRTEKVPCSSQPCSRSLHHPRRCGKARCPGPRRPPRPPFRPPRPQRPGSRCTSALRQETLEQGVLEPLALLLSSESVPMRFMPPFDPHRVRTRCWWAGPSSSSEDVGGRHNEKPLSSRYFRTIFPSKAPFSAAPTPPSPRSPLRGRALWRARSGCVSTHAHSEQVLANGLRRHRPRRTPPKSRGQLRGVPRPLLASLPSMYRLHLFGYARRVARSRAVGEALEAPLAPPVEVAGYARRRRVRCRRRSAPYSIPGPRGGGLGRAVDLVSQVGILLDLPSVSRLPLRQFDAL